MGWDETLSQSSAEPGRRLCDGGSGCRTTGIRWVRCPDGSAPLFGRGPGGGRLSAPNRGDGGTTRGAAGVGASLLRAQRPGPVDFLERAPTGGAPQTHCAKPPFSLIDGKGAVSEFGLP